jgi:hypothetical protein
MASGYYDGTGLAGAIAPAMNNLGRAMFGDPTINANNAYKNQVLQMQRQKLDLENQELAMKSPLYAAQTAAANANAAENQRRADELQAKMRGSTDLGDLFSSAFVASPNGQVSLNPDLIGKFASAAARANPALDPSKLAQSLAALSITQSPLASEDDNRRAIIMMGGIPNKDTAATTQQAQQLAENERKARIDAQRIANEPDNSKPLIVPQGSVVMPPQPFQQQPFSLTPQVQNQSPLANAVAGAPSSQDRPAYYQDPVTGAIVVPDKKANAAFGTDNARLKLIDEADASSDLKRGTAETAKFLSQPGVTEKLVNPVGTVPGLALAYDVAQQAFGDADTAFARNMWKELRTFEWLNKSSALKGAISDAENRELQSSFPNDGASADSRRLYLNKVAYVSDRGEFIENARAQALRDGQIPPNPFILRQQFDQQNGSKNPFAQQPMQTQQSQSIADAVAGAAAPTSSGIDPDIVKAMEIIARDPREKERVNQMLINAGKPPIK